MLSRENRTETRRRGRRNIRSKRKNKQKKQKHKKEIILMGFGERCYQLLSHAKQIGAFSPKCAFLV
jgi:hypothetical protein